ncbi:MAG: DUF1592 domain-containing protein [Myxococcota bacterium]
MAWLAVGLGGCGAPPAPTERVEQPGAPVLPRLNRAEYDAIARDLFGTTKTPSAAFPLDESAYGFDNNGAALTTSSLHVEGWEAAAIDLVDEMFGATPEQTTEVVVEVEEGGISFFGFGGVIGGELWRIEQGGIRVGFTADGDGQYQLSVAAMGGGNVPARMNVRLDDELLDWFEVPETLTVFELQPVVPVGMHQLELELANPGEAWVAIDRVATRGPIDPEGSRTAAYDRFVGCATVDRGCAEGAVRTFGRVAWRRPLTDADVGWAMALFDAATELGEPPEYGLRLALQAVLLSPEFLFRVERAAQGEYRALDGYEVAARLAAFLWSSTPDEPLLAAAEGGMTEPEVEAQVRRMLADPRARALVDDLAGQWLSIRTISTLTPDPLRYPELDDPLLRSMAGELGYLAQDYFTGRTDLEGLLTREQGWVDQRLAEHYGVPWDGDDAGWVQTDTARVGVLETAGWLASQSHPNTPSAVFRGKWVLDRLLCRPPPPPPASVAAVVEIEPDGGSVRSQEEGRRAEEMCQTCHAQIDGLGFVFHGFDAAGAARTEDELGFPIDAHGALDGVSFDGSEPLARWLAAQPSVAACVARQTASFALSRSLTAEDQPELDRITSAFLEGGGEFDALAAAIATSSLFRYRGHPEAD